MDTQEAVDRFYWSHGPCCAGCDRWQPVNAVTGLCTKAAPVSARERYAMLGMTSPSINVGAGHPFTGRGHHCGEFKDEFDWCTLPLAYRARVGVDPH